MSTGSVFFKLTEDKIGETDADADERQFTCITSNSRQLLHPLLPPQQEQHYLLPKRSHGYKLPEHTPSLNDSNFLTRMLYKNINRFDDIC